MKRFYLFHIQDYYPNGGMADFVRDFDTLEEALAFPKPNDTYLVTVFDSQTLIDYWVDDKGVHEKQIERQEWPRPK